MNEGTYKNRNRDAHGARIGNCSWLALLLTLGGLLFSPAAEATGTWTALKNAPPSGLDMCLLMSDGTVICANGGTAWYRLTPDIHGSYVNGSWSQIASMHYSRLFYSSDVLTNGNVYVAGGEYGGGPAELYNTLTNGWSVIPPPSQNFSDAASKILPNGNVLQSDSQSSYVIYNAANNTMTAGGSCEDMNETCWVRLPNDNILAVTGYSQTSEHYVPSANAWYADGNVPVPVFGYGGELGPAIALPNGKVFQIGATTNTAIYTPGSSVTSAGTWIAGPPMVFGTNLLGAVDAPAAMMDTGNILLCIGPIGGFNSPCSFYEYNYVNNGFTQESAPNGGLTYGGAPFGTSMLDLPDGTVLFVGGQGSASLFVYAPSESPLASAQPTISSITQNADGSYKLTGLRLNGITGGAAYGDDWQTDTSYPLVRMTNTSSANVYFARTYNWSSTTIQNPSAVTTQFTLPAGLPSGTYHLVVTVMGNASAPYTFSYQPPPVPAGLTAISGSNSLVDVSWNASAGATSYVLQESSSVKGYYGNIASTSGLAFTNTGLTNGLTYYYKIAAVGASGLSSSSAAVGATPAGPPPIPGTTNINLATYYNRAGIYTDGTSFSTGGLDGGNYAFSATLLGTSIFWNNLVFPFGPQNTLNVVDCAGQTVTLPAGRFNSLQILAAGVQGSQLGETFTVTFSDNSTTTFTQSFSDWANQQGYAGEFSVITMPYRNSSAGGDQVLNVSVNGYVFPLNQTKTVKSVTLPNDSNLILLSMVLANDPVSVSLSSFSDRAGIYTDGTTFTNPPTGGLDDDGSAYSGTLLGGSQTWSNALFVFGPPNVTNVVSCSNQTITLPAGNYSRLMMLATGINGGQTSRSFKVTYSDSTTATFIQSLSDWYTPGSYAGETKAFPMGYRDLSDGTKDNRAFNLYGYSFALNSTKTVQSILAPNDNNVIITAISLVPNWPPTFKVSPLAMPNALAAHAYSGNLATNAGDLNGDALAYAKVSGPTWLAVAANGGLSGVPANSNAGTNTFVVSVTDTASLSNIATLYINVIGAPSFLVSPFTMPVSVAGGNYSGTIATNGTDPNPGAVPSFGLVSGPAWLSVAANGSLSGIPANTDAGTNTFVVSITDSGGLSNTATLYIDVIGAPSFLSNPFAMPGVVAGQGYSGAFSTNAIDPNPGATPSFSIVSGPPWLASDPTGALSGIPFSANVGVNTFVVSVTDFSGLANTATMNITVTPAPAILPSISSQAGVLQLTWSGGIGPFQVQANTDLSTTNWQNVGDPVSGASVSITPTNSVVFYRIVGE